MTREEGGRRGHVSSTRLWRPARLALYAQARAQTRHKRALTVLVEASLIVEPAPSNAETARRAEEDIRSQRSAFSSPPPTVELARLALT